MAAIAQRAELTDAHDQHLGLGDLPVHHLQAQRICRGGIGLAQGQVIAAKCLCRLAGSVFQGWEHRLLHAKVSPGVRHVELRINHPPEVDVIAPKRLAGKFQ